MFYDRRALKNTARASLQRVRPRPWAVTLLYWLLAALIPGAITLILQFAGSGGFFAYLQAMLADPVGFSMGLEAMDVDELMRYYSSLFAPAVGAGLIATFVTVLMQLFQLVMSYGYANYTLKLYRGEPTGTASLFSGFPVAGRAIGAGVLTYIFEFLWTLLAVVLGICATMILVVAMAAFWDVDAVLTVGILLLIVIWVAVLLFSLFISYRYSLTPYFILTTDMGVMDAIRASKEHMRGNLGRRFMLELSFIGWELLNALIAVVIVLVGYFILVFALSFAVVLQAGDVEPHYFESEAYLNQVVGQILGQAMVGMGIVAVVAEAATLPIGLWLTAYKNSAYAGFFFALTGQDGQPQAAQPAADYIPPQPRDIWDQVPPPPSFTAPAAPAAPGPETPDREGSPEPEAPAAPNLPAEPEAPPAEAGPVAEPPAEPVVEAPVEEPAPVVEAPVEEPAPVVETPEEPEAPAAEPVEGPAAEAETEE